MKREDRRFESIPRNGNRLSIVPPRLKDMMIGKDVSGGIDEKASAKSLDMYGPAFAFRCNDGISTLIDQRIAVGVSTSKLELRSGLLIVEPKNRVDEAHAVG